MQRLMNHQARSDIPFWITLGRGIFAVALGLAMLFVPDKSTRMLGNFIGAFWIGTMILSMRWELSDDHSRPLTLFVGTVAVLGGAMMFTRNQIGIWVPEQFIVTALGIIAILTGLLDFSGRMRVNRVQSRNVARSGVILGIFEIALGLVLLLAGRGGELIYWIGLGWALVGGTIILSDALQMRGEARRELKPANPPAL